MAFLPRIYTPNHYKQLLPIPLKLLSTCTNDLPLQTEWTWSEPILLELSGYFPLPPTPFLHFPLLPQKAPSLASLHTLSCSLPLSVGGCALGLCPWHSSWAISLIPDGPTYGLEILSHFKPMLLSIQQSLRHCKLHPQRQNWNHFLP